MPNATRAITVMAADRWRVGGRRHVQPARASLAARTARPVPRAAGRHGTPRQPGLDGLSVLLLAKSRRTAPIDFRAGGITIRVEGTQEHGIATIWDADLLIWAASQIVEARDAGLRPSRWIRATPYEILRFIGRGTSLNDYLRLKAALDRLQSTTVATSIRETTGRRLHRFSWINEWKELADASGVPLGIELILPDWFYAGVLDAALVLTIDPAYFRLKGGIERWLYRLVRKHGGKQPGGWQFDFRHLHRKSGSAARFSDFAYDLRVLVARQSLPGYVPGIERMPDDGQELLTFRPVLHTARG